MATGRYPVVWLLLLISAPLAAAPTLESTAGTLDLRNWSFEQHPSLPLRGEWEFHWSDFIEAAQTSYDQPRYIYVPSTWNNYLWQGEKIPARGYASYRLTLLLPGEREPLALYVKSIYRAADIWINGQRLQRIGRPARHADGEIPRETFTVIPLPDDTDRLNLVVHLSSFHHVDGGLHEAFELGTRRVILQKERNRQLLANTILGATLVLAGIFLTISLTFQRRSDRIYAYGAGLSLSYGLRIIGTEKIWFMYNLDVHADWALRFEYYGMIFVQVFYLYIMRGLYPSCISLTFCRALAVFGSLCAVFITATPAEVYTHLRNPWVALFFIVFGYIGWAMVKANKRRLYHALPVGLIAWTCLLLMANDALVFFNVYQGTQINELAYFLSMAGMVGVLMGRLSRSANEADRLAAALKTSNIHLQQRVDERTKELADKVDELNQLNRQAQLDREVAVVANRKKTEFLGIMSHEVRTPLSAIQGGLQLLEKEALSKDGRLVLNNAMASSASLLEVVNNTLDITRIENGSHIPRQRDFCFSAWIEQLAGLARIPIEAKGLKFITDFTGEVFTRENTVVHGDSSALRQILTNLLNNATKFTNSGSITLKVAQAKTRDGSAAFEFAVTDTGAGIDKAQQDRVFDRFFQADTSFTREHTGTGLGLPISQHLAEAMGGEIKVDSQPGRGSRFYFTVRLAIVAHPTVSLRSGVKPESPQPIQPLHILIAEDDKANRDILRILLEQSGHKVTEVNTGAEAVSTCKDQDFDVLLLDMRLPEMDGVAACREIRNINSQYLSTPIVAVTANVNKTDIQGYLASGLDGVLPKPVSTTALEALLRSIADTGRCPPQTFEISGSGTQRLDEHNLNTLMASIGPETLAQQLANLQKNHEQLIGGLVFAWRERDLEKTRQIAHRLKGNSAYQGKNALASLCDKIEYCSQATPARELDLIIEQIGRESVLAQELLSAWTARHVKPAPGGAPSPKTVKPTPAC